MRLLFTGYAAERVASSIGSVQDGAARVIIDPGMAPSQRAILDSLASLGVAPEAITDVIFSHHHPDHTLNAALFPNARFHDHWAIYRGDLWIDRPAEGYAVSPSIRLIETPGAHAAGYDHAGGHKQGRGCLHASTVARQRPGRGPIGERFRRVTYQ